MLDFFFHFLKKMFNGRVVVTVYNMKGVFNFFFKKSKFRILLVFYSNIYKNRMIFISNKRKKITLIKKTLFAVFIFRNLSNFVGTIWLKQ
jgi:hypothetical protein